MAWLRVDDGLTDHPKFLALANDSSRWAFLRLMCWTARYRTGGYVPDAAIGLLNIRRSWVEEWRSVGLLDVEDDTFRIHDWDDYNPKDPTGAERQKRYRDRNARNADRNDSGVTKPLPRARARARGPVPSPSNDPMENQGHTNSKTEAVVGDSERTAEFFNFSDPGNQILRGLDE